MPVNSKTHKLTDVFSHAGEQLNYFAPPLRGSGQARSDSDDASRGGYSPSTLKQSKRLRKNLTEAEKKLWFAINRKQIYGIKFRRQQPIGPYIADFYSSEARLIIEVDGGQHSVQQAHDQKRTAFLIQNGYRVLRFWNNEVLENLPGTLSMIATAVTPHASSVAFGSLSAAPPQGGSKAE